MVSSSNNDKWGFDQAKIIVLHAKWCHWWFAHQEQKCVWSKDHVRVVAKMVSLRLLLENVKWVGQATTQQLNSRQQQWSPRKSYRSE